MSSKQRSLILWWTLATALGIGLGWYVASLNRQWYGIGFLTGLCQALVFLPRWRLSFAWFVSTFAGWVMGYGALWILEGFANDASLPHAWVTANGDDIGWALSLLPFVAIPIVALVQSLTLRRFLNSEPWIYWFGVPVCSFPIALLAAFGILNPRTGETVLLAYIPVFSLSMFVLGALWGLCTGWAIIRSARFRPANRINRRRASSVYRITPANRSSAPSRYPSAYDKSPSTD